MSETPEHEQDTSAANANSVRGRSRLTLPALLAAVVVIAVVYLLGNEPATLRPNPTEEAQTADSYLTTVHSRQYDKSGALSYSLTAIDAAHYPHNDESLLNEPRMEHMPGSGAQWQSRARFGKVLPNGEAVELWESVIVKRADDSLQLQTESITVYPDSNTADTDARVKIRSANGLSNGTGMHIDLNTEVIALRADVTTLYEPQKYDPQKQ